MNETGNLKDIEMTLIRTALVLLFIIAAVPAAGQDATFQAGFAKADVTPQAAVPMWGYGARHDLVSRGTRDPLYAKALVVDVGERKLALVGLDLGRSLGEPHFSRIRAAVNEQAGVTDVMMSGSHTHHGPVLELKDEPGKGGEKFPDAVAYVGELEQKLIDVIVQAAGNVEPAQYGWNSADVNMNRNRHAKVEPKPRDPELAVVRFDDLDGNPIAVMVNFAAHPTILSAADLRFSAEYCGVMMNAAEAALDTNVFFMQGAAGDLSANTTAEDTIDPDSDKLNVENLPEDERAFIMEVREMTEEEAIEVQRDFVKSEAKMVNFGNRLGQKVIELARNCKTKQPEDATIESYYKQYEFESRVNFKSPVVQAMFRQAFFPELANASIDDVIDNVVEAQLSVAVLNDELALVGGSGEFFSEHSVDIKERSLATKTLFIGYCNGHNMYFPTIEGASQGGYGADPQVSWVSLGAGEHMMNEALIKIYEFVERIETEPMGGAE